MAEHLASIFGTEKDRVNCPFYFKIGACRHGDRCSRTHNKPVFSQTLLLQNFYLSPEAVAAAALAAGAAPPQMTADDARRHFDVFYQDVFDELDRLGGVEEMHICENLSDHLSGNAYVKFKDEEGAQAALKALEGRYYGGRIVKAEYSPVTDFREARCRPYERKECDRGDYCNFMHIRRLSDELYSKYYRGHPTNRRRDYERERDRDRPPRTPREHPRRERDYRPPRGREEHPKTPQIADVPIGKVLADAAAQAAGAVATPPTTAEKRAIDGSDGREAKRFRE